MSAKRGAFRWFALESLFRMKSNTVLCLTAVLAFAAPLYAQVPAAKPAPVYCAVTDEKIGDTKQAFATKTVAGKSYYLCCPGCAPAFDAAPAKYAKLSELRAERRTVQAKLAKINADIKKAEAATGGAKREGEHGATEKQGGVK